ncbi:TetR family transcriptional regulator C-terminal domain-containing protein [Brumimicrobium oceani]|uniref:Heat-shock protein n=1 Tax=Brumimicrobium oceani TaxID=2100725 RepID=A0A2U2XDX6_9FLAO|nr:TetR family transcriptional regulator C-terminal domain-containing protein [Brumimicrobium oceani]PWH86008.1 heat-shock protein [Brumimicrobium oceani]
MEEQKLNTRDIILENYTNYVLTHNQKPKSVYAFTQEAKIEEAEFYEHFGTFEAIDSAVFVDLFRNTHKLLVQDEEFQNGDAKHKLLSFYFTFFEMLTANRSLVMYILKENENKFKTLKILDGLKDEYRDFVESLEIKSPDAIIDNLAHIVDRGMTKASYGQLLFVLKFWMEDTSPSFEKTDVLIEKTMHAGFEVLNTKPVNTFVDLGKFLWKERMSKN